MFCFGLFVAPRRRFKEPSTRKTYVAVLCRGVLSIHAGGVPCFPAVRVGRWSCSIFLEMIKGLKMMADVLRIEFLEMTT